MATVPSETTWSTGQVPTAAQLNSNIRDAFNFIKAPPLAVLRQTSGQTVSSSATTPTAVLFDTEDVDNDGGHSTSSNTSRYTAQTAGYFRASGVTPWPGNATGRRMTVWAVNGTRVNASRATWLPNASATAPVAIPRLIYLNVSDYLELYVLQDSGGNLSTAVSGAAMCMMSVRWMSS